MVDKGGGSATFTRHIPCWRFEMRIKNAPEIGWYKDQSGIYPPVYYTGKDFIVSGPKFETVKGCVIELRRSDAFGSLDLVAARAWSRKEL